MTRMGEPGEIKPPHVDLLHERRFRIDHSTGLEHPVDLLHAAMRIDDTRPPSTVTEADMD